MMCSWGPSVELTDIDISNLQISDLEAKEESLNDSGYSSAEPDEPDEEIQKQVLWDFEDHEVPTFPPDEEEEHDLNNGEQNKTKDERFLQDEPTGIYTFVKLNDKVSEMLALGPDDKMELMAW